MNERLAGVGSDNSPLPLVARADSARLSETGMQLCASCPELLSAVVRYLAASRSPATLRAYRSDLADFVRWGGTLPSKPVDVAQYIADRAAQHKPSTLVRRLVGIGRAHTAHGLADPTKSELVRAVLQGIRREHSGPARQAAPLLPQDLLAMVPEVETGQRALRDRALLLLGFAGALRRSELVALDVADLEFVEQGLTVTVRRSKTDQVAAGRTIAIPRGRGQLRAVSAVEQWLKVSGISAGAVFRPISPAGVMLAGRLSGQSVSLIIKVRASIAGLPPSAYSGHSLRAGLVTSAALQGVSAARIQFQTGHQSAAMVSRYVRQVRPFDGNAAGAVL